jgi:CBS domain-containing protein
MQANGGAVPGSPRVDGGGRRVAKLACVHPDTPLTAALGLLLEAGVSCLPVVDPQGALLDVYARADITTLAKVGGGGGGG